MLLCKELLSLDWSLINVSTLIPVLRQHNEQMESFYKLHIAELT